MKNNFLKIGVSLAVIFGLTSCKDEKEVKAEKTVNTYVVYVDSVEKVSAADAKQNWEAIDANYELRNQEATAALMDFKDKVKAQERIDASKAKYQALKDKMQADIDAEKQAAIAANPKQKLRNALFGEGKVGNDMNFNWVNAGNIHSVYQTFVHTAEDNKDKYTREDWDEVKLMYEALDSRKNTVEKEGLSSKDNMKIAGLKIKFAPMMKLNRMGAKSEEMQEAKK